MPPTPTPTTRRLLGAACSVALCAAGAPALADWAAHRSRPVAPLALDATAVAQLSSHRTADQLEGPAEVRVDAEAATRSRPLGRASRSGRLAPRPAGAMPVGDLPGWKQVLAEDFRGPGLPRGWSRYDGRPGGNPYGWWEGSHAVLRAQDLHLVGDWQRGTFVTGGVMATGYPSTYGKYEVRFKVSRAAGVAYTLLLWPARENWPSGGEIDFAEDAGGARRGVTATLHYGASNAQVQRQLRVDMTRFQTLGVEWSPGKLVYTLNGRPWAVLVTPHVPTGPMRLALQMEAGNGRSWSPAPSRATPRTADLVVDWVVAYRRA